MISALTNYLQNQPLPLSEGTGSAADIQASQAVTDSSADSPENALYAPSQRALMVSAVATDFDVTALSASDTSGLQQRLQQYGLVSGQDLNAFAVINTARAELSEEDTINAVALLDDAVDQFAVKGVAYSERQQVSKLHTLIHNIASARPLQ